MSIRFKQFLIEGGGATSKFNTERADQKDVKAALNFVSKTLDIPFEELKDHLLGSNELTYLGKKKDSGDIDIALSFKDNDPNKIDELMKKATNNEGGYNPGTKIASYAVPVNDKKVQVDLMFVGNKDWAKFVYHSALGRGSEYPGAVRNILLFTALAHSQKPGEDFVLKDESGNTIARAYKSITMDSGMKRLFKIAKINTKTGKFGKTLEKIDPLELKARLKEMGHDIKFSHKEDFTDNPDEIAEFIFGKGVKASDVMTAENVIKHIKKMKNSDEVIKKSKEELEKANLPIPEEL